MTTVPKAAATPSETPRADVLIQHNAGGVMHVVMNRPSALNAGHHGRMLRVWCQTQHVSLNLVQQTHPEAPSAPHCMLCTVLAAAHAGQLPT